MPSNTETIRKLYAAFAVGDVPTVLGALAPDCVWTEAEGFPYGGRYVGPDAVLQGVFMKIGGDWSSFTVEPREYVESGATVVAIGEYAGTYKATGKSFRAPYVHVWKFRDGKVATFDQHTDTAVVQRALR